MEKPARTPETPSIVSLGRQQLEHASRERDAEHGGEEVEEQDAEDQRDGQVQQPLSGREERGQPKDEGGYRSDETQRLEKNEKTKQGGENEPDSRPIADRHFLVLERNPAAGRPRPPTGI